MTIVSRSRAISRGLACLAIIGGIVFIPQKAFAQG